LDPFHSQLSRAKVLDVIEALSQPFPAMLSACLKLCGDLLTAAQIPLLRMLSVDVSKLALSSKLSAEIK